MLPFPQCHTLTFPASIYWRDRLNVEYNDWGMRNVFGATGQQIVYHSKNGAEPPICGWSWDYSNPGNSVLAYPEVICGKKPWHGGSTHDSFPLSLLQARDLTVDISAETTADPAGSWNNALDAWIVRDHKAEVPDIAAEVMVWIARGGDKAVPAGRFLAEGGIHRGGGDRPEYGLYSADATEDRPWPVFTFVRTTPIDVVTIPLGLLLGDLASRELLDRSHFLASVEFGTEIWEGRGHTVVKNFRVS